MKKISCYYGKYQKNFGDVLTPLILDYYLQQYVDTKTVIKFASINPLRILPHIVGMGSLLNMIPSNFPGHIWTTGNAHPQFRLYLNHPEVHIHAVRGMLTLEAIEVEHSPVIPVRDIALGDGALLLPRIFPKQKEPDILLGIMPHVCDYNTVIKLPQFSSSSNVLVMNLRENPMELLQQVKRCKFILSSSLHGLIVADAYGIPNARFEVDTSKQIVGGSWKFQDYYSCFGIAPHENPPVLSLQSDVSLTDILHFIQDQRQTHSHIQQHVPRVTEKLHQATVRMVQMLKTI